MQKRVCAALIGAVLCVSPALADEAWVLPGGGEVTWDDDVNDVAVLSYPVGLSAAIDDRGIFHGYWIGPSGDSDCAATLTGPDGTRSAAFGQAIITFDQPSFPSGWSALIGQCFDPPSDEMRADAIYGNQIVVPRN